MTAILIAAGVALLATLLGTPIAIRLFRLWGWGQHIREDGPQGHLVKTGTPTMGGAVIIGAMCLAYLVARVRTPFTTAGLAVLGVAVGLGVVGSIDDLIKIRRQRSLGLNKTTKFLAQAVVAVAFAFVAVELSHVSREVSFIRADTGLRLGIAFYVWVFLMVAASSNGVNLTDGLDGLASGSAALVFAAYVIISFWQARHSCFLTPIQGCYQIRVLPSLDVAIVAAGALGAVAGFLWWNAAPAKIFMGDTGSLALGGLMAGLAVMTETQLLLLVLGGLYVLVTTSVILQVGAFRLTGRRLFRMAPIHHHFELVGWPEFTVIVRFWILAGLAVAFGLGLFYADFLARGGTV
ncbi:MAG: phospho-N-acetylmuramoyl-pentapeptide-transferase [Actinomycetota bacterium]|nr:phospho-N-acetylmuramoyl-pentapeptide-transferase [Actinomycetota bacterium]